MSRLLLSVMICLGYGCAFAQPLPSAAPGDERQNLREQRRIDLRNALQVNRQTDAPDSRLDSPVPGERHLSARERAEMRQQLRQQKAPDQRPTQ